MSEQTHHWLRPVLRRAWNSPEKKKARHMTATVSIASGEICLGATESMYLVLGSVAVLGPAAE